MAYVAITVEGGLLPSDLLERLATGEGEAQRAEDFGLSGSLSAEIQSVFSDVRAYWDAFQHRLARSRESVTTLTREHWLVPVLEALGFTDLIYQRSGAEAGGESYAFSHRAGSDESAPPVHMVGIDQSLDTRSTNSRRSPHALVQEYLNRSDALWGVATNGAKLRLLRNSARLSRPTYLEVDLQAIVEGNLYNEFVVVFRLLHRSRFPRGGETAGCPLERLYQQGIDEGGRVREHLRDGVEQAIRTLGNALLTHPESTALRESLRSGQLSATAYYRQLLRLIYRLLFLLVVEERRLLFPTDVEHADQQAVYGRYYSMARLRDRCEHRFAGDREGDLWQSLLQTFRLFREDTLARCLGLRALGGELFGERACAHLERAACDNASLLAALYGLSTFTDKGTRRRVNYAGLDVEELGSVYESLLEYHPRVELDAAPAFDLIFGSERKQTGSHYTPPPLVHELIESALVPVLEARMAAATTREAKEQALLGIRVCDSASGSGHFLLAAARRIARELAKVRSGEEEPAPSAYRLALRDVIRNCIYAVDKNVLAVDLCKVALWIEGYSTGLPLSFLDHHIKHGDSLVGIADLDVLVTGIPDEAFTAVTGDDKQAAAFYKKRNKAERTGQLSFDLQSVAGGERSLLAREFAGLGLLDEGSIDDVAAKEELYSGLRDMGSDWWRDKVACDLWTAAFFVPLKPLNDALISMVPTTGTVRAFLRQPKAAHPAVVGEAVALSDRNRFFHWPLEFPEVAEAGGFDVQIGNPPWERIKLQELEFFASRDPEIAAAPNKAARERLIKTLPNRHPALAQEFAEAQHDAEAQSVFMRQSGRYPLCGRGDVNTYGIFAELLRSRIGPSGRAGIILPTGIATDDTTKYFFRDLMEQHSLVSLHGFENEAFIFPAVHHAFKFCLVTLAGTKWPQLQPDFAYLIRHLEQLRESSRHFTLTTEDIALLNPNTRTCPIFRTHHDAELTKSIYRRISVLVQEDVEEGNPWGIRLATMFHMSNDSKHFRTADQLLATGWQLQGNVFTQGIEKYLPLFEAKLLHQFDHRWATYDGVDTRDLSALEKQDPTYLVRPRYWVPESEVHTRMVGIHDHSWLLTSRMIAQANNGQTLIAAASPVAGYGNSAAIWQTTAYEDAALRGALLANLNSFVGDYAARQKVGGSNLNFFYVKQFAILPPAAYVVAEHWTGSQSLRDWITTRVLELTYIAWDMQPLGCELGYDGPPFIWNIERRFLLRCELDAAFFHLYQITRDDVSYVMETFPIIKQKDEQRHGEYRTKRVILELYDKMQRAIGGHEPYQTPLDPPPAYGWTPSREEVPA